MVKLGVMLLFNVASGFPPQQYYSLVLFQSHLSPCVKMPVLKNMSKAHQNIRVGSNYDNCVVTKYPFKEHIPPQTTMEVKPCFLPASLMNNSESLCGMNKWFNNEHQQSSLIVALIFQMGWGKWGGGVLPYKWATTCVGTHSMNRSLRASPVRLP